MDPRIHHPKDGALGGAADGSAVPGRVRVIDNGHVHVHEHVNEHDHP
ncbi:MAG: hypothetical protein ACR2L2_14080 [Acidobacteriota bacterium]